MPIASQVNQLQHQINMVDKQINSESIPPHLSAYVKRQIVQSPAWAEPGAHGSGPVLAHRSLAQGFTWQPGAFAFGKVQTTSGSATDKVFRG